jgi:hypothetical protein
MRSIPLSNINSPVHNIDIVPVVAIIITIVIITIIIIIGIINRLDDVPRTRHSIHPHQRR